MVTSVARLTSVAKHETPPEHQSTAGSLITIPCDVCGPVCRKSDGISKSPFAGNKDKDARDHGCRRSRAVNAEAACTSVLSMCHLPTSLGETNRSCSMS